jgi:hypothetical protein
LGRLLYRPNKAQRQQLKDAKALEQAQQQQLDLLGTGTVPGLMPLGADFFGAPVQPAPSFDELLALSKALVSSGNSPFTLVG